MWHLWLQTSSKACGHATRGRQSVQAKLSGLRGHSTEHTLGAGGIHPAADGQRGASTVHSRLPQPLQLSLGISRPHKMPHIWVWRLKFYETLDKRNGKCLFFPLSSPCPFPLNSVSDL